MAYLGLYSQQHRGQEGAGVVAVNGNSLFNVHRGLGLVSDVFRDFDFDKLPGRIAIGHVRYSTAGGNKLANVQPFSAEVSLGRVAIAHNGNLVNTDYLRKQLIKDGAILSSTSDTELILHLLARAQETELTAGAVISAIKQLVGAYSLLFLFKDRLLAVRDPRGLRPLALGRIDRSKSDQASSANGAAASDCWVVASETCAFDLIGAEYVRDIEPGEVLEISATGYKSYFPFPKVKASPCIFEYVYFARPDSSVFERNVYNVRKQLGRELAKEAPVQADFVVPVPDSGLTAALGYSEESKIPLELGLIRNHYVGRTFIEPKQTIRDFGVKVKLNANRAILEGKRIIVIDDSIVRGTTSRKLVRMLKAAGAKEVHMRISAPPTTDPCYYGVDTPDKRKLIAANMSQDQILNFIEADSLAYLSMDGMYRAVKSERNTFCDACFSGNYPLGTPRNYAKKSQKEFFNTNHPTF